MQLHGTAIADSAIGYAISDSYAGGFLPAMLQGENAKKSAPGYIHSWRINAEDATFFLRPVFGMKRNLVDLLKL
jgi:hypothetical protein